MSVSNHQKGFYTEAIWRQLDRLKAKSTEWNDYVKAGQLIFGWLSPQADFETSVFRFWEATDPIMAWIREDKSREVVGSHMLGVLSYLYGRRLPFTDKEERDFSRLMKRCLELSRTLPEPSDRQKARQRITSTERLLASCMEWERAIGGAREIPDTSAWGDPEELAEKATTLAPLIAQHRMYGVKSCFIQDGILHSPPHAWVYLDGADEIGKFPKKYLPHKVLPLAIIHLARRKDLRRLEIEIDNIGVDGDLLVLSSPYTRLMTLTMQTQGTLVVDPLYGIWPLEEVFQAAGRADSYPAFWLSHLLRVSDLIVPETVRREHGVQWPVLPLNRRERQAHLDELPKRFPTLYLPRRRLLENPGAIRRAQQQEDRDGLGHAKGGSTSSGHVWFWRRLPEGYKASPQMRALALEERGMEPPEGYTYVKELKKEGSSGHEAKRRPASTE